MFADHVQALVRVGDESLLETVRGELGDRVALALAPTTDTSFTEPIKSQLLSATAQRQTKLDAMERALGAEADSLRRTVEATPAIEDCLDPADRRPLLSLDSPSSGSATRHSCPVSAVWNNWSSHDSSISRRPRGPTRRLA
ncbi:DUF7260 family protein [Halovenus salina]|uniref:DUF7260 domain-containing protein n=1 Tax=Halovenus salina TaxID=1510225 RepID=A0ABD5VY67_9EURY